MARLWHTRAAASAQSPDHERVERGRRRPKTLVQHLHQRHQVDDVPVLYDCLLHIDHATLHPCDPIELLSVLL